MTRLLATVALLALPAVASAQVGTPRPAGPPVLGGRPLSGPAIVSGGSALFLTPTPAPSRFGVGGGSLGEPTQTLLPSGAWGGVRYAWPVQPVVAPPVPVTGPAPVRIPVTPAAVRPAAVDPQAALSDRAKATLVVQFPAAAEIWVGGKKADGDPAAEWTLTSPAMKAGESHTFEVKGRWKAGGKTYEAERKVAVTAGDRNRSIVVSGTEVKE